jgi:uncharacterized protein
VLGRAGLWKHQPVRVRALHRYPVKSLLGEELTSLTVDVRGVDGDRLWSVRTPDGKIGSGKNSHRFAAVLGLLELRARVHDGRVTVTFPDGRETDVEAQSSAELLSSHLGRPLTFARETDVTHFDDGPVSLIGTASVEALEQERGAEVSVSRFRPNLVLDTDEPFVEDGWVGRRVVVGDVELEVVMTSPRCVMVDMKTADLPEQHGNLLAVGRLNDACLGVIASVVRPGTIRIGDSAKMSG